MDLESSQHISKHVLLYGWCIPSNSLYKNFRIQCHNKSTHMVTYYCIMISKGSQSCPLVHLPLFLSRRKMMKIRKPYLLIILLLCTMLLITACNREMELSPEAIELEAPVTYGSAELYIDHKIAFDLFEFTVETYIPIQFPVKRGDRHVDSGEFSVDWVIVAPWELGAAGDVAGVSSTMDIPVTYKINGVFQNCEFKLDIVEIMHFSQVKWVEVLAWGKIEADLGDDEDFTFLDQVLSSKQPAITIRDPGVVGRFFLELSKVSLPPDTRMICGYVDSD